jgi:hypothetical protein
MSNLFSGGEKSKKTPKYSGSIEDEAEMVAVFTEILNYVYNNRELSTPVYLPQIKTERDIEYVENLPFVYIWNENKEIGSFSVSINGGVLGSLIENYVTRETPDFYAFQEMLMEKLSEVFKESVIGLCQNQKKFPSEIFSA